MIKLDNEWVVNTCYTKILDVLYNYRFFYIEYFGIKIDAHFKLPSDTGIEIPREINLGTDNIMTIKFSLDVSNHYHPVFNVMTEDYEICDNDDQIDCDFLQIYQNQMEKNYQVLTGALKRVYWYHNLLEKQTKDEIIKEKEQNRDNEINNME